MPGAAAESHGLAMSDRAEKMSPGRETRTKATMFTLLEAEFTSFFAEDHGRSTFTQLGRFPNTPRLCRVCDKEVTHLARHLESAHVDLPADLYFVLHEFLPAVAKVGTSRAALYWRERLERANATAT